MGIRYLIGAALALLATPALAQQRSVINLSGMEYNGGKPNARLNFDYVAPSDATYAAVKAQRFWGVRLPISEETLQPDPVKAARGELAEPYASQVVDAVTRGQKAGLTIIVDLHNYGRYYGNPVHLTSDDPARNIRPMYVNVVGALAKRLQAAGAWGLSLTNEPHDIAVADLQSVTQDAVHAARSAGFRGYLFYGDAGWSTAYDGLQITVRDPLPGGVSCIDVHAYGDGDNSGTYRQAFGKDGSSANTIVDRLRPAVEQAKREKRCLFVGEIGAPVGDVNRRDQVLRAARYLAAQGVDWAYWTAGEWTGNDANSTQAGLVPSGAAAMIGALPGNR